MSSGDPEVCPACYGLHHNTICPRTIAGGAIPEYAPIPNIYHARCEDCGIKGDDVRTDSGDPHLRCNRCADRRAFRTWTRDQLSDALTEYLGDEVFASRFADCMTMIRQKNADYTQGTAKRDRIAAFRRIGRDINVPMRKVWYIFASKHWQAVSKYIKEGFVESEPIDSRIDDIINYMVLLGAIIDDEKLEKTP